MNSIFSFEMHQIIHRMRCVQRLFLTLLVLLPSVEALTVTSFRSKLPLQQLNRLNLYLTFDGDPALLTNDYIINLYLDGTPTPIQNVTTITFRKNGLNAWCNFDQNHQRPILTVVFQATTSSLYVTPLQYSYQLPNIYFVNNPQFYSQCWAVMTLISQWLGYLFLLLLLINCLMYCLPLLRIIQLTAMFVLFPVNKPVILNSLLFGAFKLNSFTLYSFNFISPFLSTSFAYPDSVPEELSLSPTFVGNLYSPLMQISFLLIGMFIVYIIAFCMTFVCKLLCLDYFTKWTVKSIFLNSFNIYFTMHIPIVLTTVTGLKYLNIAKPLDLASLGVSMVGLGVAILGSLVFPTMLAVHKGVRVMYLKRGYIFACRNRRMSEIVVFLGLFKDVIVCVLVVMFHPLFCLLISMSLIITQIVFLCKADIFFYSSMLALKILERILLLLFLVECLGFCVIEMWIPTVPISIMTVLDCMSSITLLVLYSLVLVQTLVQIVRDLMRRLPCREAQKVENVFAFQRREVTVKSSYILTDDNNITYKPVISKAIQEEYPPLQLEQPKVQFKIPKKADKKRIGKRDRRMSMEDPKQLSKEEEDIDSDIPEMKSVKFIPGQVDPPPRDNVRRFNGAPKRTGIINSHGASNKFLTKFNRSAFNTNTSKHTTNIEE